ncbi:Uncharacterised protein [Klebsiella pneumoniae]|nr:Uncharacterised protein [Klebsiella pneumoniae]
MGLDAVAGTPGGIAGVVRRAAAGGRRLQVLGKPDLAVAEHQPDVPGLGAGDGLRQLARRSAAQGRRGQRRGPGAPAPRRSDRRRTEGIAQPLQGRLAHPEDLQPVPRPQRALAQRAALVPADRPAGKRQDQPAGLFRTGIPDRPQADPRHRRHALLRLVLRRPRRPDRHRRALPDPSRRRGRRGRLGDPARPVAQAPPRTAAEWSDGVDSGGNVAQRRRDGAGYAGSPGARAPAGNPADPAPRSAGLPGAEQGRPVARLRRVLRPVEPRGERPGSGHQLRQGAERHRCDGPAPGVRGPSATPEQPGDHAHPPGARYPASRSHPRLPAPAWPDRRAVVPVRRTRLHRQPLPARQPPARLLPDQRAAPGPAAGRGHRRHRRQPGDRQRPAADPAQRALALHPSPAEPGDLPRGQPGRSRSPRTHAHPLGPASPVRRFAGAPSAIRPALGWRFLGQPRAPGAGPRAGAAMGPAAPGAWRARRRHGGAEDAG